MKQIKLSMKIGLGFAALLLITCALGVMAILSMDKVSTSAAKLSNEYVPQVNYANHIERHVLLLMYAMRGYSSTKIQSYRDEALKEFAAVKKNLDLADAFSREYPEQVTFKNNLKAVRKGLLEYEQKADQTEELIKTLQGLRDRMEGAADLFLMAASNYHDSQISTQEKEFSNQEPNYVLRERAAKIKMIYVIVKEAQSIQTSNYEAQVLNDPDTMESATHSFFVVFRLIKNIEKKTKLDANKKSLTKITNLCKEYESSMKDTLTTWRQLITLAEEQNDLALKVLKNVESMATEGMTHMNEISNDNVAQLNSAKVVTEIGLGIALLIGILLAFAITRAITKPVLATVTFAERVADGHLDDPLNIHQNDEIGNLAESLRKMVANLKTRITEAHDKSQEAELAAAEAQDAMHKAEQAHSEALDKSQAMTECAGRLHHVAEITTSASEQLSAQVEQSSKGAEQQARRVSETATAIEEMSATVLEVAKNAGQAAEISDAAKSKAQEGAAIVDKVVQGISAVQTEAQTLKNDMAQLGEQAENIGQIMSVISDIADQTNLLALNAAIEAARAGEAGRGFAVVADEVRKLAEKTMAATKEVGDAISHIQQGTRKNMENVDRTVTHITEATAQAGQSGEALIQIVNLVEQTSDQVNAIATASEEQSAASEQISRSIEEVNTISSETAEAMTQAAQAVSDLAGQSLELRKLIDELRSE